MWRQVSRPAVPHWSSVQAARRAQQSSQDKARGTAKTSPTLPLEAAQVHSIAKSIKQISKEVCPPGTSMVRQQVTIDGHPITVEVVPTSVVAEMIRQNPAPDRSRI